MPQPATPLSKDEVFDILSNSRRRYVLYHLRETGTPVPLGELAEELAAWENETQVENLTKQQRKRVYVSLYQTHIQKLSEAGIVEYDSESGLVSLDDGSDQIGMYLTAGEEDEERQPGWQVSYVALAAVSAIAYAGVALDVSGLGVVPEFAIGAVILVAFALLFGVQYLHTRRENADVSGDRSIGN